MKRINLEEAKKLLNEMGYELCTTFYDAFEIRYDVLEDIKNECWTRNYDDELTKRIIDKFLNDDYYMDYLKTTYDKAMDWCSPYMDCLNELFKELLEGENTNGNSFRNDD